MNKRWLTAYRSTAPAFLFVLALLIVPLVLMLRLSLFKYSPEQLYVETLTIENYVRFFTDDFYRQVLWTTLSVSAVTTALCLLGGTAVAYFVARTRSDFVRRYLVIAIVLPLFMGSVARTAGWIIILDNKGLLNFLLTKSGIVDAPLQMLYTPAAVVAGLTSVLLPYMVVTLNSVMHNIDASLEEASENLGASRLTTFLRVVLPLLMPGIYAGSVLCFTLSMNAYATPVLIGGPTFYMMAPTIYGQMTTNMNWPFASALAFILICLTMALTLCSGVVLTRSSHAGTTR